MDLPLLTPFQMGLLVGATLSLIMIATIFNIVGRR